ncbi:hypothetical protein GCM10007874_58610 [Labrys miyagiensis]|uniref:Rap1a immunity protein domain-containing protein n=2 Tax=Labrys miyagiensis TaxID=346912 RepID=A0ABQ6CR50_9HYPH|nr:hypothetical protein GCM10007874_58610 [Labrys miyagiensis]
MGGAAQAQNSANHYYEFCVGFIKRDEQNLLPEEYCGGTVNGVAGMFKTGDIGQRFNVCIPEEATTGQEVKVLVKYMDQHPEKLNWDLANVVFEAFREAWPCGN